MLLSWSDLVFTIGYRGVLQLLRIKINVLAISVLALCVSPLEKSFSFWVTTFDTHSGSRSRNKIVLYHILDIWFSSLVRFPPLRLPSISFVPSFVSVCKPPSMMYSNKEGWMIALRQACVGGDAAISPTTTTWLLVLELQFWMPDCNLATLSIVPAIEEDLLKEN